jgi:pectinesterase
VVERPVGSGLPRCLFLHVLWETSTRPGTRDTSVKRSAMLGGNGMLSLIGSRGRGSGRQASRRIVVLTTLISLVACAGEQDDNPMSVASPAASDSAAAADRGGANSSDPAMHNGASSKAGQSGSLGVAGSPGVGAMTPPGADSGLAPNSLGGASSSAGGADGGSNTAGPTEAGGSGADNANGFGMGPGDPETSTGVSGGAASGGNGSNGGGAAGMASDGAGGTPAAEVASPVDPELAGSTARPQLTADGENAFTMLQYLRRTGDLEAGLTEDGWDPRSGVGDVAAFEPSYRVASTGGTHASVQAAVDAAVADGGTDRIYIEVAAGTYREVVCVPSSAPPITLYGVGAGPEATTIVFNNYSGKAKAVGTAANPCNPSADSSTYGTSGSATFAAYADEFRAKNLTFSNDTNESNGSDAVQAVALMTRADRTMFDTVRILGNQDTLYGKTSSVSIVQRVYFKGCYVEGDTDFIFGRATMVLDGCTIHSVTNRINSGVVAAPSTDARNPYGILFVNSTFTGDGGAANNSIHLARAWDEGQGDVSTYAANVTSGVYPNGQATFRNSELGAHIRTTDPYRDAATTGRPYSSVETNVPANRFYEYGNTGPGSGR